MLKLRRIGIDTYRESLALIARNCGVFRPEEHQALQKVAISHDHASKVVASLAIVDDETILSSDELGLTEKAFERLGLPEGTLVHVAPASPPASLDAVRAKIHGHTLDVTEIQGIINDIATHQYSDMEIAAFLISSASFMTTDEMLHLTRAMADVGNRLTWPGPLIVDKHCIGGIPGNRTSMIIVPIVAAHGLIMPKTSSRAITSPAGTADTMEVLARVDLSGPEMKAVVNECNGCLVWGGHVNLSPADDILISVERPLAIDIREQMVASILSKKLAAGSTHLLIDIPVGPSSKVRGHTDAMRLRKLFEFVGDQVGLHLDVVTTEAIEPIGRGIGPVLEARDVMAVLDNNPDAPGDLREKSLRLAGHLLEYDPKLRGGSGYARAKHLLESGKALEAMDRIITAQGRAHTPLPVGHLYRDVLADRSGTVVSIDCYRLARIARLAGAPMDKGAGIDIFKKSGSHVETGEPLYRILSCVETDLDFAWSMAEQNAGYSISVVGTYQGAMS